ncbi:uncharacterized protein LOC127702580 isoform X1 [Mytilus californianus]|uniref:uncharacterized protein LOC127702580 isoform X1 n=1 Tax=Mytilus californianus TaxID=6549 RepID=UPI0022462EF5|nr:uncharacterized protein LOC127702580 isoform X1 [Mytilus californianus]XP_052062799.1 uncharacterized protein LOC127702580 isoform X1 [Mytilus californianus]XP_052062800.1 uncharacterized protein LOC127702580 isoform X1 [Mytilus californianus]XP_052062801.1 uncharacterized protein LOC127702580 isoform X1 [Mytilus californianus]XP_052062802.1 uncharacterized protein LOC127702580 isoform X1 [Mytilus californianus]XP_052062803.1 uncharacterized protein LOC127702580 isoform X1 [Mytilus californ
MYNYLVNGFKYGFDVGFRGSVHHNTVDNLLSAKTKPDIVRQKIQNEINANRFVGPFDSKPFTEMQLSPLGLAEKKMPGTYRMIHHLSFPEGSSINDNIPQDKCSVQYASIQDAIELIKSVGRKSFCAKTDISSAFRIINIKESQYKLFGFMWEGKYYYDKNLQMGCSSSCQIFENFSTAIEWIAKNKVLIPNIVHILDDFMIVDKTEDGCKKKLERFLAICKDMGIPISKEKTFQPSKVMSFVGYEIDTRLMEVRLPIDKLDKCHNLLTVVLQKEKITLRELQSIIGTLNFACAVVIPGRAFLRRLIDLTIGVKKSFHRIRMTKSVKQDLNTWQNFLKNFNGKSLILSDRWLTSDQLHLFTDASGTYGYGALFGSQWFLGKWDTKWQKQNIAFLELYPIVLAVEIWGHRFENQCIYFHTDNIALASVINKQTSKDALIMFLIRRLVLHCLRNNVNFKAKQIYGSKNVLADALSRQQVQKFHRLAPWADTVPKPVPNLPDLPSYRNP